MKEHFCLYVLFQCREVAKTTEVDIWEVSDNDNFEWFLFQLHRSLDEAFYIKT